MTWDKAVHTHSTYDAYMIRRTTIELDDELLGRAKKALGLSTTRATVEEALRRATDQAEDERTRRAERQRRFLSEAHGNMDLDVLGGDEMWR
jgi:Arc/MetJ family transcription regulator